MHLAGGRHTVQSTTHGHAVIFRKWGMGNFRAFRMLYSYCRSLSPLSPMPEEPDLSDSSPLSTVIWGAFDLLAMHLSRENDLFLWVGQLPGRENLKVQLYPDVHKWFMDKASARLLVYYKRILKNSQIKEMHFHFLSRHTALPKLRVSTSQDLPTL